MIQANQAKAAIWLEILCCISHANPMELVYRIYIFLSPRLHTNRASHHGRGFYSSSHWDRYAQMVPKYVLLELTTGAAASLARKFATEIKYGERSTPMTWASGKTCLGMNG